MRDISVIGKVFRKISLKANLFNDFWFDDWKYSLDKVDTVIIFASQKYPTPVDYIKKHYPEIKIIYWYWNPVSKCVHPNTIPDNLCEKWTFDRKDSSKYALRYNTTFYFNSIELPKIQILQDLIFVGVNKGRKSALDSIQLEMEERGIKSQFYIVDDLWQRRNYRGNFPPIKYDEYLKLVAKSKAILDYVQEGQNGLTLRPMESIFFKKKLITNDSTIKKEDFYNPKNIFVLDADNLDTLKDFLESPYIPIPEEIVTKYDADNWIDRFQE